jgi:V8-like Glu-specific endopeptidase
MPADVAAEDWLDAFAERTDYAVVGPRDNRVQLIATTRFPLNTICHLGRDFGDGKLRGCTGFLIAPRVVVTAGHCLYNVLLRRAPRRIVVMPGRRDRDTLPYGAQEASRAFVARSFIQRPRGVPFRRADHDYGVALLPAAFRGLDRFMPLDAASDANLERIRRGGVVTIAGYPGDRPIGTLWRHAERLKSWDARRLLYTVDTCPGHSGSPICHKGAGNTTPEVIGIHRSGITDEQGRAYGCSKETILAPPGSTNSGIRITPDVLADLRQPERMVAGAARMIRVLPGR